MKKVISILPHLLVGIAAVLYIANAMYNFSQQSISKTISPTTHINQDKICFIEKLDQLRENTTECKEGELVYFTPEQWGSERLPTTFAAMVCDTNHQIVFNNSSVLYVFTNRIYNVQQQQEQE